LFYEFKLKPDFKLRILLITVIPPLDPKNISSLPATSLADSQQ
jgi:hypothetical protein